MNKIEVKLKSKLSQINAHRVNWTDTKCQCHELDFTFSSVSYEHQNYEYGYIIHRAICLLTMIASFSHLSMKECGECHSYSVMR